VDRDIDDPIVRHYVGYDWAGLTSQPAERVRFVVFDCETSGLDVERDELLSLSAVVVQNGVLDISDRLDLLFRAEHTGGRVSAPIHGILPRDLVSGSEVQTAVAAFLSFVRGAVLVGHHVGFDVAMVQKTTRKYWTVDVLNPRVDTARLYARLTRAAGHDDHLSGPSSLDDLMQNFGIPVRARHSASGDAFATAQAFLHLAAKAKSRGLTTVRQMTQ
jgi:DNA polymerase-3 subunit epsilon